MPVQMSDPKNLANELTQIHRKRNYLSKTITANYSLTNVDKIGTLACNGTLTVTLTGSTLPDREITIMNIGSGVVTISGTINGVATSYLYYQYAGFTIKYIGSAWYIMQANYDTTISGKIDEYTATGNPSGWLNLTDYAGAVKTIGNAASGATYAAAYYETLFNKLKSGWGNAGTEVFANGNTVKLPDLRGMFLRGTGTHGTLLMANGNAFAGPSLGVSELDKMQGHWHTVQEGASGLFAQNVATGRADGGGDVIRAKGSDDNNAYRARDFLPDNATYSSSNGNPRSGDETNSVNYGIHYIIKI